MLPIVHNCILLLRQQQKPFTIVVLRHLQFPKILDPNIEVSFLLKVNRLNPFRIFAKYWKNHLTNVTQDKSLMEFPKIASHQNKNYKLHFS